jgi:hypothetical protein
MQPILTLNPYAKKLEDIPKGKSEAVNRRRTDNTMTKRKKIDLQSITQKTKY